MMLQAYAKINLGLNVLEKREDGYHELDMIMLPITLHDSIDLVRRKDGQETYVTCDSFELNESKYNLVHKAVEVLNEEFNIHEGFRVTIYKRIPVSAGLGGGSADAAAVILGIIKMLKLETTDEQLIRIGKKIGSDVPYCLFNRPARVRGVGEKLTFIESNLPLEHCLLIRPKKGLSTETVFTKGDQLELNRYNIEGLQNALLAGDINQIKENVGNALEKPAIALCGEIEQIKSELEPKENEIVMMSGSGSCVFFLSNDKKRLLSLMEKYYKQEYQVELCKVKN